MYELSDALSAAFFPLSVLYIWRFVEHLRDKDNRGLFAWSLFLLAVGLLMSWFFSHAEQFGFITESKRLKLSAITKSFLVLSLALGIYGLEMRTRGVACVVAFCLFLGVLVCKVIF